MKIIITGSRGFIGTHLKNSLQDHDIVEWDTKIDKDIKSFVLPSDVSFVVHLAGLIDVRDSINIPDEYWLNNVTYSKRIFDLCNQEDVPVVYASSAAVKEWWRSPYGTTKRVLEEISYSGQIGLRFETVFGEGSSAFGLYTKIKNNTLEYKTNHIRDFIHVDDIADCIKMFINYGHYVHNIDKVYEVGTGNPHKVSDVVNHFGLDVPLLETETPYEIYRSVADTTKISNLGWKAKRSIYD